MDFTNTEWVVVGIALSLLIQGTSPVCSCRLVDLSPPFTASLSSFSLLGRQRMMAKWPLSPGKPRILDSLDHRRWVVAVSFRLLDTIAARSVLCSNDFRIIPLLGDLGALGF